MKLDTIFSAVAFKKLAQVDLPGGSHQHEINGSVSLQNFFDTNEKINGVINWSYFQDEVQPIHESSEFTFYDSRKRSSERTHRIEWRLYYYGDFLFYAQQGDILILFRKKDNSIYGLIFQQNSSWIKTLETLFNIDIKNNSLKGISNDVLSLKELDYVELQLLKELGFDYEITFDNQIENIVNNFFEGSPANKVELPSTSDMAKLTWDYSKNILFTDPDLTLITWLQNEEKLFRAFEQKLVMPRLVNNFKSVDEFIEYSKSVQNRRKSRMGLSLENHLNELFKKSGLIFEKNRKTEGNNKPDFIFPGQRQYKDPEYDPNYLFMLGAKSTCKDRWRQILTEADRIKTKHLCTLQQTISIQQTNEMKLKSIILIVPKQLQNKYTDQQKLDLLSLSDFIAFIKDKQLYLRKK